MSGGDTFEYIVVGSGAGGGTLAARLAEAGSTVLLLEAGGDPRQLSGSNDQEPGVDRLPDDYDVPSFHGFASENDAMRWDFFVRHYTSEALQEKDPKYVRDYRGVPVNGILYPRAGTLGGCTAHNAMILVYPHNADWDGIARLTSDQSWSADNMRRYFMRLENCHYRPLERALAAGLWPHGSPREGAASCSSKRAATRASFLAPMTISPASTVCPTIMTCRRSMASPARTMRCGLIFLSGIMPRTRCSRRTRNTARITVAFQLTASSTRAPEPWAAVRPTTR